MIRLHIADTGLFVAMGQPSNSRYQAVRRFARRNNVTFVLPERVYEELTVDDPDVEAPPIDEGWATVAAPLEFSKPVVSRVMDGVQRYIAKYVATVVERLSESTRLNALSCGPVGGREVKSAVVSFQRRDRCDVSVCVMNPHFVSTVHRSGRIRLTNLCTDSVVRNDSSVWKLRRQSRGGENGGMRRSPVVRNRSIWNVVADLVNPCRQPLVSGRFVELARISRSQEHTN